VESHVSQKTRDMGHPQTPRGEARLFLGLCAALKRRSSTSLHAAVLPR
jgi:hypothetical protein